LLLKLGDKGTLPCFGIVIQVDKTKTNQSRKKEFKEALWHKDPLFCTISVLTQYLFWRFKLAKEPLLDFWTCKS
jgi:hypothetical protein